MAPERPSLQNQFKAGRWVSLGALLSEVYGELAGGRTEYSIRSVDTRLSPDEEPFAASPSSPVGTEARHDPTPDQFAQAALQATVEKVAS